MSIILYRHFYCDSCKFKIRAHAGHKYIIGPSGERCYLRGRGSKSISEVLGMNPKPVKELMEMMKEVQEKDIIKSENAMICWECFNESYLSPYDDNLICTKCTSTNLTDVDLLMDEPCPVCERGTLCAEIAR